jgi:hypothetical protein
MKLQEKLKRVKLISEKLYIENYKKFTNGGYPRKCDPNECISAALEFVEEFENFENGFMKDHGIFVSFKSEDSE